MDLFAYLCFIALVYCYFILDCFLEDDTGEANDLDISLSDAPTLMGVEGSFTIGFLIWFIYKYIKLAKYVTD
jgi:hypothetical protein